MKRVTRRQAHVNPSVPEEWCLANLARTVAFHVCCSATSRTLFRLLGFLFRSSRYCLHQITYFLLPSALGERTPCMCVCVCVRWLLSVGSSDRPPPPLAIRWKAPPASVARQQPGGRWGEAGAHVPVAVTVGSCVCSWGRRLCYQQVLSGCQESSLAQFSWQPAHPLPPLSAADWSEVITGPLWLNTRDIK